LKQGTIQVLGSPCFVAPKWKKKLMTNLFIFSSVQKEKFDTECSRIFKTLYQNMLGWHIGNVSKLLLHNQSLEDDLY